MINHFFPLQSLCTSILTCNTGHSCDQIHLKGAQPIRCSSLYVLAFPALLTNMVGSNVPFWGKALYSKHCPFLVMSWTFSFPVVLVICFGLYSQSYELSLVFTDLTTTLLMCWWMAGQSTWDFGIQQVNNSRSL